MSVFNSGSPITADGDYPWSPPNEQQARKFLFICPVSTVTAGSFTLKQGGAELEKTSGGVAFAAAGHHFSVEIDTRRDLVLTVSGATGLSANPDIVPLSDAP